MKTLVRSLALFSVLGLTPILHAATIEIDRDIEDNDIRALKEWIDTKRQVSLKEIGGDLSLSGEVRTEFQNTWENRNNKRQRGPRPSDIAPQRGFDIEFNFMLDFRTERTWAAVKVEFDNDAGVFSGTLNKVALERCYWGARVLSCDTSTFDIEIGRRQIGAVFDSKVQFGSFFDGILFRYDRNYEVAGDFYVRIGPFIINDRRDHFGYVGEVGLLNIHGTGFYTKLSLIDWDTKHYEPRFVDHRFEFIVMQLTPGYRFKLRCWNKVGIVYSAFLWNFEAKELEVSNFKRANYAFYAGVSIGQLLKQWDWAFDINYQVVAAQAIPDFDVSGIGLGNANRSGFYTATMLPIDGGGIPNNRKNAGGMANYHGFAIRLDILLSDKIDFQQSYQQSRTLDSSIGPFRTYKQYEIEFIYSW